MEEEEVRPKPKHTSSPYWTGVHHPARGRGSRERVGLAVKSTLLYTSGGALKEPKRRTQRQYNANTYAINLHLHLHLRLPVSPCLQLH